MVRRQQKHSTCWISCLNIFVPRRISSTAQNKNLAHHAGVIALSCCNKYIVEESHQKKGEEGEQTFNTESMQGMQTVKEGQLREGVGVGDRRTG